MFNTSATGGYLLPSGNSIDGQDLRRFLQSIIVGVTGLDGALVRQSFHQNPAPIPGIDIDWCAFFIASQKADANPYIEERTDLSARLIRHERLTVQCALYGPHCLDHAGQLRDGLYLSQNRDALKIAGIGLVDCTDLLHVPELVNDRYYDRADVSLLFNREVRRDYPVLSFLAASGTIYTDGSILQRNWSTQ